MTGSDDQSTSSSVGNGSTVDDPAGKLKPVPKWTSTASGAALGIALILFGCCANVMTLEILTTSVSHYSTTAVSHRLLGSVDRLADCTV